jgi:hypothetical protein
VNIALLFRNYCNLDYNYDNKDYEVEILCFFYVGKTKMSLVHFIGYSMDYDQIISSSKLQNYSK